jgi:hypothetical protein
VTAEADAPHVGLVVEGRGEEYALPVLLRKRLAESSDWRDLLGKPVPCHGRDKALTERGIEGYVATAAARPGCEGVLVVLDAEEDAACVLGPALFARASDVAGRPVSICLAEPKFEAWLVASAETLELQGLGFRRDRDPVGLIRDALPVKYVKPTWQPRLASRVDFAMAVPRDPSLSRMLRKFEELVARVPN